MAVLSPQRQSIGMPRELGLRQVPLVTGEQVRLVPAGGMWVLEATTRAQISPKIGLWWVWCMVTSDVAPWRGRGERGGLGLAEKRYFHTQQHAAARSSMQHARQRPRPRGLLCLSATGWGRQRRAGDNVSASAVHGMDVVDQASEGAKLPEREVASRMDSRAERAGSGYGMLLDQFPRAKVSSMDNSGWMVLFRLAKGRIAPLLRASTSDACYGP